MLTSDEIEQIREEGPYTEDFSLVKQLLNPRAVAQSETEWMLALMLLLGGAGTAGADEDGVDEDGDDRGRAQSTPSSVMHM